jgi:protein SCO1/2
VTGLGIQGVLGLRDEQGRVRRLADFRGKAVLLFFGYTGCPDVCPTTLLRLAEVVRQLGTQAARVQVLWVTVDPERDTRAVVGRYVHAFNPGFIGLRGTPAQTQAVAEAFRIHYQVAYYKGEALVSHSAFGYLMDGRGHVRVRIDHEAAPERIASDVRTVLASS